MNLSAGGVVIVHSKQQMYLLGGALFPLPILGLYMPQSLTWTFLLRGDVMCCLASRESPELVL
jgi:hypothetical protein